MRVDNEGTMGDFSSREQAAERVGELCCPWPFYAV